ncbi:MAG: hypothetical protein WAK55_22890, partial [Xanthobacteraceae bacterium]
GSTNDIEKKILKAVSDCLDANDDTQNGHWKVGFLLVAVCGEAGPSGKHNGSSNTLRKIAKTLKDNFGERASDFSFEYLRQLRRVAEAFKDPGTRLPGEPWAIYRAAGDPKTLDLARKDAKQKNVKLTVAFVTKFVAARGKDGKPSKFVTMLEEWRRLAAEKAEVEAWLADFLQRYPIKKAEIENLKEVTAYVRQRDEKGSKAQAEIDRLLKGAV